MNPRIQEVPTIRKAIETSFRRNTTPQDSTDKMAAVDHRALRKVVELGMSINPNLTGIEVLIAYVAVAKEVNFDLSLFIEVLGEDIERIIVLREKARGEALEKIKSQAETSSEVVAGRLLEQQWAAYLEFVTNGVITKSELETALKAGISAGVSKAQSKLPLT